MILTLVWLQIREHFFFADFRHRFPSTERRLSAVADACNGSIARSRRPMTALSGDRSLCSPKGELLGLFLTTTIDNCHRYSRHGARASTAPIVGSGRPRLSNGSCLNLRRTPVFGTRCHRCPIV